MAGSTITLYIFFQFALPVHLLQRVMGHTGSASSINCRVISSSTDVTDGARDGRVDRVAELPLTWLEDAGLPPNERFLSDCSMTALPGGAPDGGGGFAASCSFSLASMSATASFAEWTRTKLLGDELAGDDDAAAQLASPLPLAFVCPAVAERFGSALTEPFAVTRWSPTGKSPTGNGAMLRGDAGLLLTPDIGAHGLQTACKGEGKTRQRPNRRTDGNAAEDTPVQHVMINVLSYMDLVN